LADASLLIVCRWTLEGIGRIYDTLTDRLCLQKPEFWAGYQWTLRVALGSQRKNKAIGTILTRELLPLASYSEPYRSEEVMASPNWTATGSPYLRKSHKRMDNQVMAMNATETTTRLNLRIRLSYACAQLSCWSLSNVRFAVPTNPLALTGQDFKPDEMESQAEIFPKRKQIYHRSWKRLKIQMI
jgi:hypothetical protein